jgi:hypothetical protein
LIDRLTRDEGPKTKQCTHGPKEGKVEILILWIVALVLLDIAALMWGADSRDGLDSAEWARRRGWRGFNTGSR